jgi:hypothetical protein
MSNAVPRATSTRPRPSVPALDRERTCIRAAAAPLPRPGLVMALNGVETHFTRIELLILSPESPLTWIANIVAAERHVPDSFANPQCVPRTGTSKGRRFIGGATATEVLLVEDRHSDFRPSHASKFIRTLPFESPIGTNGDDELQPVKYQLNIRPVRGARA